MDKAQHYGTIVERVLSPYTNRRYNNPNLENEAVFDRDNHRYLIMQVGWEGKTRRVHGCLLHLDIINGKIWVQRDGTEYGVTRELEQEGVPKFDIVLAFHSESVRPHTGYAVA